MPKDTKTLGNNKARAWESLGFVHKKRLCQRFDTTSSYYLSTVALIDINTKDNCTFISCLLSSIKFDGRSSRYSR